MTDFAQLERRLLADLLHQVGPDEPTVCAGWTTRDLAAHLVVRDRRPDAMVGMLLAPLAAHGEKVRQDKAKLAYEEIVAEVRKPPWWSPVSNKVTDEPANLLEYFIHHEDVRRAQPQWEPRELSPGEHAALWKGVRLTARLALRKLKIPILVRSMDFPDLEIGTSETEPPRVMVHGEPGEIALFVSGRQRVARVEVRGQDDAAEALRQAELGM